MPLTNIKYQENTDTFMPLTIIKYIKYQENSSTFMPLTNIKYQENTGTFMPLTSLEGGGWWETEKKPCFGILRLLRLRRASNPSQSRSKQEQLRTFIMPLKICFDSKGTFRCIIKLEYSGVDGLFDASVHLRRRWGRLGGLAGRFLNPDKLKL